MNSVIDVWATKKLKRYIKSFAYKHQTTQKKVKLTSDRPLFPNTIIFIIVLIETFFSICKFNGRIVTHRVEWLCTRAALHHSTD